MKVRVVLFEHEGSQVVKVTVDHDKEKYGTFFGTKKISVPFIYNLMKKKDGRFIGEIDFN